MIVLEVTKNQGLTLFLDDTFLEKSHKRIKLPRPPSPGLLRVKFDMLTYTNYFLKLTLESTSTKPPSRIKSPLNIFHLSNIFLCMIFGALHCVKSVQIQSFFWSVFSCIWTEYRKIRTRKNSVFGHFSGSARLNNTIIFMWILSNFKQFFSDISV